MESPKSLTAIVHVKFHYIEPKTKPVSEGEIEMMANVLDKTSDLSPEMRDIVVKFAEYLGQVKAGAESP